MAKTKSIDEQIKDLQDQIDALEAKKKLLANPIQEYPKWVAEAGREVANAEEEKTVRAAHKKASPVSKEPTAAEVRAKKDADEDRAKGKK